MDAMQEGKAGDGLVEYTEFEAWFLQQEERRVDSLASLKAATSK